MLGKINFTSDLSNKAKAALMNWNFVLDKNSVAAGIYAMWERRLYSESANRFIPQELKGLVSVQLKKLIGWLENPDQRFGTDAVKGRDAFLQQTFELAVKDLSAKLGNDTSAWTYGQSKYRHTALTHPLNAFLSNEQKEQYNLGPLPRGGNGHTPNATGGGDRQAAGASFRIIADLADWDRTLMINTPGQSADPKSRYYSNLFQLWANDGYLPSYYSRGKIESATEEKLVLTPVR
jgi:penicillin amidase